MLKLHEHLVTQARMPILMNLLYRRGRAMVFLLICTLAILVSPIMAVGLATAEVQSITATHTYVMGDRDSKEDARAFCYMTAKRKALDKAGVLIESSTEITNFKLSKDQIQSYSAAILSVEIVREEFAFTNGVNTLTLTVTTKVDIENVRRRLTEIGSNKDLRAKVDAQQEQIRQLEMKLQELNQKLGGTSAGDEEQVRQDRDEGLLAYSRLGAERGEAVAQFYVGLSYALGRGVPKDDAKAVAWYRKAAEQGLALAQAFLGAMYATGNGVPQDYTEAISWLRKAAEQGLAEAQFELGVAYYRGEGVPQDDVQAVAWYRKAAEQGLAAAETNLGWMYDQGRGIPQDDVQAVAWYRKAAEQGYALAQYKLAAKYAGGKGVLQDERQAAAWVRKAADQGHADAQVFLGTMYGAGKGVPQDYGQAHKWFNLAAAQGHKKGSELRDEVAKQLSPAQLAEAQRLAREWTEAHEKSQVKK